MRSSSWTPEDALAAGRRFLAQYGTLPKAPDLRACYGLPSGTMIRRLFGSLRQFQEQLAPAEARRPPPASPPARCLHCEQLYTPAHRWTRICPRCKDTEDWHASLEWMGGSVRF
jgi:hypothetical protein